MHCLRYDKHASKRARSASPPDSWSVSSSSCSDLSPPSPTVQANGTSDAAEVMQWMTPQGTPAERTYVEGIQHGIITWWYKHRRNDLPWRPDSMLAAGQSPPSPPSDTCGESPSAHGEGKAKKGKGRPVLMKTGQQVDVRPSPYAIWVSEVMSQQTQLSTVIAYYAAWMKAFPTVEALAAASESQVRALWSGMGYYRRALYLLRGAQYIANTLPQQVSHMDGGSVTTSTPTEGRRKKNTASITIDKASGFPSTAKMLEQVPGIGPYTAAAIASICYGEPAVAVDGNLVRVFSRLRGERNFDPKKSQNIKKAFQWGHFLMVGRRVACTSSADDDRLPEGVHCSPTPSTRVRLTTENGDAHHGWVCSDPGAFNQGLMELGARVCKPNGAPLCSDCPLRLYCRAHAALVSGEIPCIEGVIPLRGTRAERRVERVVCVVHELLAEKAGGGKIEAAPRSDVKQEGVKREATIPRCHAAAGRRHTTRHFIVTQRPEGGLLGGMMEFPSLALQDCGDTAEKKTATQKKRALEAALRLSGGASPDTLQSKGSVSHIFSHISMTVDVFVCRWTVCLEEEDCSEERKGTAVMLPESASLRPLMPARTIAHQLQHGAVEVVKSEEDKEARPRGEAVTRDDGTRVHHILSQIRAALSADQRDAAVGAPTSPTSRSMQRRQAGKSSQINKKEIKKEVKMSDSQCAVTACCKVWVVAESELPSLACSRLMLKVLEKASA